MSMQGEDLYSGSALSGAGTGAVTGAAAGSYFGPYGTVIGGVLGGVVGGATGAYANSQRRDATSGQQANLSALQQALRAKSAQRYRQYLDELNKAESFYGPAQAAWDRAYGVAGSAPSIGQGSWSNTGVK